jgi:hypothetical protein
MTEDELKVRYEVVEKLTKLFKFERMVYLLMTIVALIILLVTITLTLINGSAKTADLTLMFGSSGLITISIGRLLKMWDQALKTIVTGNF